MSAIVIPTMQKTITTPNIVRNARIIASFSASDTPGGVGNIICFSERFILVCRFLPSLRQAVFFTHFFDVVELLLHARIARAYQMVFRPVGFVVRLAILHGLLDVRFGTNDD
jgi:hypothetical protein